MLRYQGMIRDLDKSEFHFGTRQEDINSSEKLKRPEYITIPGSFLEMDEEKQTDEQIGTLKKVRASLSRLNPFKEDFSIRKATQRSISKRTSKDTFESIKPFSSASLSIGNSKKSKVRMSGNANNLQKTLSISNSSNHDKFTEETLGIATWRMGTSPPEECADEEAKIIFEMNGKGKYDRQSFNLSSDPNGSQASLSHLRKSVSTLPTRPRTLSSPPRIAKGRLRGKRLETLPPITSSPFEGDPASGFRAEQKSINQESPKSTWTCSTTEETIPPSPFFHSIRGSSSSSTATTAEWSEPSSIGFDDATHTVVNAIFCEKLRQYKMRMPSIGEQSPSLSSRSDRPTRPKTPSRLSRSSNSVPPPRPPPPASVQLPFPSTPKLIENPYHLIPSSPPSGEEDYNLIF